MQKFLVGSCIGGFHISKKAARYLASVFGTDSLRYLQVTHEFEKCYNEIEQTTFSFDEIDEDEILSGYQTSEMLRTILLNCMLDSRSKIDLGKLDSLNQNYRIRIVQVPDGVYCHVLEDGETGYEYVEECHRSFSARPDEYYNAECVAKRFAETTPRQLDNGIICSSVEENGNVVLKAAWNSNFMVIKVRKCFSENGGTTYSDEWLYFIASYVEYYKATSEHPQAFYEIKANSANDAGFPICIETEELDQVVNLYQQINK